MNPGPAHGRNRRSVNWMSAALAAAAWANATGAPAMSEAIPFRFAVTGVNLQIERRGAPLTAGDGLMFEWIHRSASIVKGYYGYFPVSALTIRVDTRDDAGMGGGHANALPGPHIDIAVGRRVSSEALIEDWVLVHEMIHFALPDVGEAHSWLSEGLATYVEGIARVQAGNMTDAQLWREYVLQMPKGLPGPGDRGLDRTHNWARTYWGGALFCLLADVQIRAATHGRAGLQTALQAIGRNGGMTVDEDIESILRRGDAATGTTVLQELYAQMKDEPVTPDLALLWRRLGVPVGADPAAFDDAAPLATVRQLITAPAPAHRPPSGAGVP